jgi:hypothetical protein
MTVKFAQRQGTLPENSPMRATFQRRPLDGLKLIGFGISNVEAAPAERHQRQYSVNGERKLRAAARS